MAGTHTERAKTGWVSTETDISWHALFKLCWRSQLAWRDKFRVLCVSTKITGKAGVQIQQTTSVFVATEFHTRPFVSCICRGVTRQERHLANRFIAPKKSGNRKTMDQKNVFSQTASFLLNAIEYKRIWKTFIVQQFFHFLAFRAASMSTTRHCTHARNTHTHIYFSKQELAHMPQTSCVPRKSPTSGWSLTVEGRATHSRNIFGTLSSWVSWIPITRLMSQKHGNGSRETKQNIITKFTSKSIKDTKHITNEVTPRISSVRQQRTQLRQKWLDLIANAENWQDAFLLVYLCKRILQKLHLCLLIPSRSRKLQKAQAHTIVIRSPASGHKQVFDSGSLFSMLWAKSPKATQW